MNLLDNDLVRRYFGCQHAEGSICDCVAGDMPCKILTAMQEPIRKGERYLKWDSEFEWVNRCNNFVEELEKPGFHPYALRLPDRFQKREEKVFCSTRLVVGHDKCGACGEEIERQTRHIQLEPKPQAEECSCFNRWDQMMGEHRPSCPEFKPKDAVEEKIKEIVHEFKWSGTPIARKYDALRELVELARKS